jgi:hypothetical protein
MKCLALAVAIATLSGCDRDASEGKPRPATLRVSASFGLATFYPGPSQSGSSSQIIDLVYEPAARYVETVEVRETEVLLRRKNGAPLLAELVDTLRVEGLVAVEPRDGDQLLARFGSASVARGFGRLEYGGFERGPFVADAWVEGTPVLRLRSREDRPVMTIELIETSVDDQWRRLLARDIDVVPHSPPHQRELYQDLSTVRLLEVPSTRSLTLFIDVRQLADPDQRKFLASAIDREAIARVGCGDASLASTDLLLDVPAERVAMPALRLAYLDSDVPAADAARALRLQLFDVGILVTLEPSSIEDLTRSDAALLLGPADEGDELLHALANGLFFTRYENPVLSSLVASGDTAAAWRIAADDMPLVPLYHNPAFAAIDTRFCGGAPVSVSAWDWLADLRPCEDAR